MLGFWFTVTGTGPEPTAVKLPAAGSVAKMFDVPNGRDVVWIVAIQLVAAAGAAGEATTVAGLVPELGVITVPPVTTLPASVPPT